MYRRQKSPVLVHASSDAKHVELFWYAGAFRMHGLCSTSAGERRREMILKNPPVIKNLVWLDKVTESCSAYLLSSIGALFARSDKASYLFRI